MERKKRKSDNELISNRSSEMSSLSAISIKRSHNDENIDLKDEQNKKILNQVKYLDVEFHLNKDKDYSFDEDQFHFEKNSQNFLQKAFAINEDEKSIWEQRYINMMIEEGIIKKKDEFNKLLRSNELISEAEREKRYTFNALSDEAINNTGQEAVYFTKFLIALNLIFRISYIYKYDSASSYNQAFFTIYRILLLQLFDFDDNATLFSIQNKTQQYIFFGLVVIWCITFIFFYIMINSYGIERFHDEENYTIKYKIKPISNFKMILFHINLTLCIYIYIPIVRDSILTLFFIVESVKTDSNFSIFFQTSDASDAILWVKFFLCAVVAVAFFIFPFKIYKVLKLHHPILNPLDEINDTMFHSEECPKSCSGALLDIDRRMCWDFAFAKKKKLFIPNLNRPISLYNYEERAQNVLVKYFIDCYSIQSPLMIFFQGYSFYFRDYLFWFMIKHYFFIFIIKIPFSTLFKDFAENNIAKRSLISFSLCISMTVYVLYKDIRNFNKKFNFKHDMVLCLIVDVFILLISILAILKVSLLGDYIFITLLDLNDGQKTLISALESTSFAIFLFCCLLLFLFMLYSIPSIKDKIKAKVLKFPMEYLEPDVTDHELKSTIIEMLWKPFWDNLFISDKILLENVNIDDNAFYDQFFGGKKIEGLTKKYLALNAANRIKNLRKKLANITSDDKDYENEERYNTHVQSVQENVETDTQFQKITKCDILLRKWIQFRLEGIDVFWDGDVLGKRTCLNYWGRLIIDEHPFKVLIIYDETNEKTEVPEKEWISLCKLNLSNHEVIRQLKLREHLRILNGNEVKYDYFFRNNSDAIKTQQPVQKIQRKKSKKFDNIKFEINSDLKIETQKMKFGILKVESILPDNSFTHGFNVSLDVQDQNHPDKIIETIQFDANDICLNMRNFKYSQLGVLINMNTNINIDDKKKELLDKKNNYREETCCKRYINEITLSSHFYSLVYDNEDISLMELFKYFLKYEKRPSLKLFPFFHIEGFIRACYLWELLLTNSVQSLWYIFFYETWTRNKKLLTELKVAKYFDPDSSLSICFYVFDRKKLNFFIQKLDLQHLFPSKTLDLLFSHIEKLKKKEKEKLIEKLKNGHLKGQINLAAEEEEISEVSKPQSNQSSSSPEKKKKKFFKLNDQEKQNSNSASKTSDVKKNQIKKLEEIDEEKIEKYTPKYQTYRDKFIELIREYSPLMCVTPTWVYLSYNNEYLYDKIDENQREEFQDIRNEYSILGRKNAEIIFEKLGDYALFISAYTDSEIFDLYENRHLNVEDPLLGKMLLQKESQHASSGHRRTNTEYSDIKSIRSKIRSKYITTLDWGSKTLEISLPPIYKVIDEKLLDLKSTYTQKIDDKGRVFYVNTKEKTTSFLHPQMKKREKSRLENELEVLYGDLPEDWEVLNYKAEDSKEARLLYINKKLKKTSWIDPRKKKKIKND